MPDPSGSVDSLDWTPGEALRKAAALADESDAPAGIAILLNNNGGLYETGLFCAGLKTSEVVALLDVAKTKLLLQLAGQISPPDIQ